MSSFNWLQLTGAPVKKVEFFFSEKKKVEFYNAVELLLDLIL